jgi:hypothetical protein
MFILKRQDVEISMMKHPNREQQIPILNYQDQIFRLISVFAANQKDEAKNFWQDLTDNQGKFCILLEEPERFSIWGRIRKEDIGNDSIADKKVIPFTQACILLLQTIYFDVEDLLGSRQAKLFEDDIGKVFQQWHFPQAENPKDVKKLLDNDPLASLKVPSWEEHHLITLLQELYRIGKAYFGNENFAEGIGEILQDMPDGDKTYFKQWLQQSPLGKMWRWN